MRVVVDGVVVLDSSHPPATFQPLTAVFVATSSSAVIRFENDSPDGDNSFFIDAVSVVPSGGSTTGALTCQFETGDGIGGTESLVGDAPTSEACMQMVHQQQPSANGVTYSNSGGLACYAEFGMTGNNGGAAWQTCMMVGLGAPGPPPAAIGFGQDEVTGCSWRLGDGTGGTESNVGRTDSAAACVSMVRLMEPTANGATYSSVVLASAMPDAFTGGTACYAEFGMTSTQDSAGWQTCLLVPGFCNYVVGDGIGGTEQSVGDAATAAECVNMVLEFDPYEDKQAA